MRRIDPLTLNWKNAVLMQENAAVSARPAMPGETMPNGEATKTGDMVVLNDEGSAVYCMGAKDFDAHWQHSGPGNSYSPRPAPRRVFFMDQPGYLPAPAAWGPGREGWTINKEFAVSVGGKNIKGYPVIEHEPGVFMYEDLNKGRWAPVTP